MNQPPATLITYAITGIIIAIVFAVRWRRMRRETLLRLERLWMLPAFYAALVAFVLAERPPSGAGWFYCAVALAIGAALGWQRGRMMTIRVDPDSHALRQTSSPAAMLFIFAIVLLRQGARGGAGWLHLDVWAVTDMLMALALGLIAAQRLEMYLRGKRLLMAARLSRA